MRCANSFRPETWPSISSSEPRQIEFVYNLILVSKKKFKGPDAKLGMAIEKTMDKPSATVVPAHKLHKRDPKPKVKAPHTSTARLPYRH